MLDSPPLLSKVSIDMLIHLAQYMDDGIVITDSELDAPGPRILFVNDSICQMTGYTREELIGKNPRIFQGIETSATSRAHLRKELAAGRTCHVELTNYHKNGKAFTNEILVKPYFGQNGTITHYVSIERNVSIRNAIVQQLGEGDALLQLFLSNVPSSVAILDRDLRYVAASPRWMLDYGLENREVLGARHFEVFPETPERWKELYQRGLRGESSRHDRDSFLRKNGKVDWLRWELVPWKNEKGEIDGIILFSEWLTASTIAEDRLQASNERLEAIWSSAADGMILINPHGVLLEVNRATTRMFGYEETELIGQNVGKLVPEAYRGALDKNFQGFCETGIPGTIGKEIELMAERKDGQVFPVALTVSQIVDSGLFCGVIRDLSERVELQKQVLEIAEAEDQRIGQELHDNLQQHLTGLGLLAQSLADSLAMESSKHSARAKRIAGGLRECGRIVRQVARGLIPVEVHANGLQSALWQLAASIEEQCELDCEFSHDQNIEIKDNFTATHLYRIAQEAVTNAVKHSHAKKITISLADSNGIKELKISDDGLGLNNPGGGNQGQGLKIMQYRASLFGGNLVVAPSAPHGTEVICQFQNTAIALTTSLGD